MLDELDHLAIEVIRSQWRFYLDVLAGELSFLRASAIFLHKSSVASRTRGPAR